MGDLVKINHRLLSSSELPPCDGPKLHAFPYRDDPIEWIGLAEDCPDASNSDRQGYVFKVRIRSQVYALKVFKFFDPITYRWYLGPVNGEPVSDDVLGFHTDPFYAECRAYGRLQEAREKQGLERRDFAESHGFLSLKQKDAAYLEDLGIDLWDVPPSDEYRRRAEGSPVRAILKDFIPKDSVFDEKLLNRMLKGIRWINKQGVLVGDIHPFNFKDGLLIDFGLAWTKPHCRWAALPPHEKVDIHVRDLVQFQEMAEDLGFGDDIHAIPNFDYMEKLRRTKAQLHSL
ncbi:kinetochore Sim4 complex subunit FTA2-domain-containing protein [Xylaria cf. heliscus]|nr:kinetochore Sim4 complex subunit FTA2-domain-containing protein [Xylaria cf. heliscus]